MADMFPQGFFGGGAGGFDFNDPRTLGLLGAAASLLEAGGASARPVNMAEALGRGLKGGLGGYQLGQQIGLEKTRNDRATMQLKKQQQSSSRKRQLKQKSKQLNHFLSSTTYFQAM